MEFDTPQNFYKPAIIKMGSTNENFEWTFFVSDSLPLQEIIKSDYPTSPEPSQMDLLPMVNKS